MIYDTWLLLVTYSVDLILCQVLFFFTAIKECNDPKSSSTP